MESLKSFFLFCSGIHPSILKRTPTDTNKYAGIGATIFFTGIFAGIAGAFALHTVFQSYVIAVIFGLIWGLMIFNLDRFIVMSMKKKKGFLSQFATATPRLILAVLIAFVISKPLELKLFQSEIAAEIVMMEQETYKLQEDKLKERYQPSIDSMNSNIETQLAQIEEKRSARDVLSLAAIQEADGTGGSMNKNLGPIYKAKKAEADNAQLELDQTVALIEPIVQSKRDQASELEANLTAAITNLAKTPLNGFAAQIDALGRIAQRSNTIWFASLFITLLFIAIETAPIFTKLIAHRSPYDFKLDEHEYKYEVHHKYVTSKMRSEVEQSVTFETEVNNYKRQETIGAEKEIIAALVKHELDRVKSEPLSWKSYLKNRSIFGT